MQIFTVVALVVLLAFPVAAAPSPAPDATLASLARLSGPSFDVAFMRQVIPLSEEAVEVALTATLYADHTEILRWNQKMIERKNVHVRQMLAFLQEAGAAPAQRNAGVATATVKKIRSLRGAALERTYLSFMITHFDRNVALSRLAATKANRSAIRALAQEIVRVESQEAAMLRGWQRKWYAGSSSG